MNNETSKAADVLCPKGHTEPHSDCKHCGIIGDCLDNSKTELIGVILQWHDAYYKEQTRVNKLILDHAAEVERLSKERDAEIAAWQDAIYKVCVKAAVEAGFPDHVIDGAGSDGDELAFTLAEIDQALNCVTEAAESKLSQLQLANEEKARKIADKIQARGRDDGDPLWANAYELVLAILNGGQQ